MKINNKGFMLAEVVVVSVVIAMILVTSFTGLNKISRAFETRSKYFDIDSEYFAIEVNNYLTQSGKINVLINDGSSTDIDGESIQDITAVYVTYGYVSVAAYFSLYNEAKINTLTGKTTFDDYIKYFTGHYDFSEDYTYVIITEMCKTEDDCRYYGYRVR